MVNNLELYKRAFVHRSYTKRPHFENLLQNITIVEKPADCMALKSKSNERLEFLGDGVLELVTKYYLYRRFPKENEGFMTEKTISIVKIEAIGKATAEAYEKQVQAMGADNFSNLKVMESIGTNNIKIIPEILISGGGDGANGPISGLLGMELLNKIQEKNKPAATTPVKTEKAAKVEKPSQD
jgi:hypothetical protein